MGPEHAFFKDSGRAEYVCATDGEAMEAFQALSQREGIIPALESAHAVAHAMKVCPLPSSSILLRLVRDAVTSTSFFRLHFITTQIAKTMKPTENILINLSGRGDKDMFTVAKLMGVTMSGM